MRTVIFDIGEKTLEDPALSDVLKMLGTLGSKWGVVTDGDHRVVVRLNENDVHPDAVVCSDNSDNPRTVAGVLGLLDRMQARLDDVAFVTGDPAGARIGAAAGVETIGVGPAMKDVVELRRAGASSVIPDVTGILELV